MANDGKVEAVEDCGQTCNEFVANKWKTDLCVNCQRHQCEHKGPRAGIQEQPCTSVITAESLKQHPQSRVPIPSNRTITVKPGIRRAQTFRRPVDPPPKPVVTVGRSSSMRENVKPQIKEKPATLKKPNVKVTRSSSLRISTTIPKTDHYNGVPPSSVISEENKTPCSSLNDSYGFYIKLNNLQIDVNMLHHDDKKALQNAWKLFPCREDENLGSSVNPFLKLAYKIKKHHERMLTGAGETNPNSSFMSTEAFYGSVDITDVKPSDPTGSLNDDNAYDNASNRPAPDPRAKIERVKYVNQQQGVKQPINILKAPVDNLPVAPSSPKYDRVPSNMTNSQESSLSERIYAEVLDVGETTLTLNTSNNQMVKSEYEEIDVNAAAVVKRHQEGKTPQSAQKEELHKASPSTSQATSQNALHNAGLASSISRATTTRMSFIKSLLRKGKREEADAENSQVQQPVSVVAAATVEDKPANRDRQVSLPVDISTEESVPDTHTQHSPGKKSSLSPKSTLQRPEVSPPPPPSSDEMSKSVQMRRSSSAVQQQLDGKQVQNLVVMARDRNGEFIPISPSNSRPSSRRSSRQDDIYDKPWGNTEQVLCSILKQDGKKAANGKPQSVSLRIQEQRPKTRNQIPQLGHVRQTSMPSDGPNPKSKSNSLPNGQYKLSLHTQTIDSGYESATASSRKSAPPSDTSSHASSNGRLSLPGSSNNSRPSSPQPKLTSIDSYPVCLEQINNMNKMTLQKVMREFMDKAALQTLAIDVKWENVKLAAEEKPLYYNNRCIFYRVHRADNPADIYTAMLSLKTPMSSKSYSPNLLCADKATSEDLEPKLFPAQILAGYKSLSPPETNSSEREKDTEKMPTVTIESAEGAYDKPWDSLLSKESKALEESYKEGLLSKEKASKLLAEDIQGYVTLIPNFFKMESIHEYIKRRETECQTDSEFAMDCVFIILQVLNIIFGLSERSLQIETISANDLIVVTDKDNFPTVLCHMLSVKKSSVNYKLTCEKMKMFLIQLAHASDKLAKHENFKKVESLISESADQGDLKTISHIIQYLLWGPTPDEVKIISVAESRKQAFEMWVQLARAKLVNRLASRHMDKLKIFMIASFLVNTTGPELYRITKLLNTY